MKILILKDVYTSSGWKKEGDIVELDNKTSQHYLRKGIGVEHKEVKINKIETKEQKAPKKRTTKTKK